MKKLLLTVLATAFALNMLAAHAAVDLNSATAADLQDVSGIGPKKAEAIVEYRKKNGQFKTVDDLDKVPGFGKSTVDKVRKDLTIGGAKTAAASTKNKAEK